MSKSQLKKLMVGAGKSRILSRVMGPLRNNHVPVFMLHRMQDDSRGVKGHSPQLLREALKYLRDNGYHFLSLRDLVKSLRDREPVPPGSVVFTIDDGFYDQAAIALPIFEEFSCPVTIFLISGFTSGEDWPWDYKVEYILGNTQKSNLAISDSLLNIEVNLEADGERKALLNRVRQRLNKLHVVDAKVWVESFAVELGVEISSTPPDSFMAISWDRARECENDLVSFGPHTHNHTVLASQTDEWSLADMSRAWEMLTQELKAPLPVYCYPIGRRDIDFSTREMINAKSIGMEAALSVTPGYVRVKGDTTDDILYALNRFAFPNNLPDFIQLCSWLELVKEKIRNR